MRSVYIFILLLFLVSCSKDFLRYQGYRYKLIDAGSQRWMAEDLQAAKYRSGKKIPVVKDVGIWPDLNTPACGFYNNDSSRLAKYGLVYNWKAVEGGKLCPRKWRVPSQVDWDTLETFLGGDLRAGGKMKSVSGWKGDVSGDDIGFDAKAGGYRLNMDLQEGHAVVWWSSTIIRDEDLNSLVATIGRDQAAQSETWVWGRRIENYSTKLWTTANRPNNGFYIRCMRNRK